MNNNNKFRNFFPPRQTGNVQLPKRRSILINQQSSTTPPLSPPSIPPKPNNYKNTDNSGINIQGEQNSFVNNGTNNTNSASTSQNRPLSRTDNKRKFNMIWPNQSHKEQINRISYTRILHLHRKSKRYHHGNGILTKHLRKS